MEWIKTDIEILEQVVLDVFRSDTSLQDTYHVRYGEPIEDQFHDTMSKIKEAVERGGATCYVSDIGFVVLMGSVLYSFGIKKSERTQEGKEFFTNFVKSFSDTCYLWSRNTRAVRFMVSIGFTEVDSGELDDNKFVKLCLLH